METKQYLTITQLTKYIKAKFDRDPYLGKIYLTGEISGFRNRGNNNHQYFSLKDENAVISVIMFKNAFQKTKFKLEDGMKVLVTGRLSLYEKNNNYSVIIDTIQPDGVGALYLAFEQLKEKLSKEGLFQLPHRSIPKYPRRIAVVTSPSGAVIRDIMTTVKRRYPIVELVVYPTVVQGEQAAPSILRNLKRVEQDGGYDTVILARGGGSIEDLWCFNDESVVRQISQMRTPLISSIGHETDTTLSDYVADQRAATPTAAAELATPSLSELCYNLSELKQKIYRIQSNRIQYYRERIKHIKSHYIFKQPEKLYDGYRFKLVHLEKRLTDGTSNQIKFKSSQIRLLNDQLISLNPQFKLLKARSELNDLEQAMKQVILLEIKEKQYQLNQKATQLDLLSPLKRLAKGYAFVTDGEHAIQSVKQVNKKDMLKIQLIDGFINATVENVEEKNLIGEE